MKKTILFFFFLVSCVSAVFAQPNKVNADKIIGVVGNKIVMKSDIDDRISDMQRQGMEIPDNAGCYLLQDLLGTKTLVLQAEKDSLPVTDEEVESDIDNRIRNYIGVYGSSKDVEAIAGKTIYQLKEDMRDPIRDQKLAAAMRNKIVENVRITPYEVKQFFDKIPADSLPYYETEVEIGQIISYPRASTDAEEYARQQLVEIKEKIESGKMDFRKAASLYSEEPGAQERSGQMEVNRNQKDIDPAFLAKAFTVKEGQISNPFRTRFGYHILQVVSRNGDDVVVMHIIKIPKVTNTQIKAGFEKMDSVRAKLIAGTMTFGTAVDRYSDDQEGKFTAGMIQGQNGSFLTIDQLDKDIVPILKNLKVGGFSQPMDYTDATGKKGVRIIYLKTQTEPHRENMKDDYSKIADRALNEKKENVLEQWFSKRLSSYYIMIDPAYRDCDSMKPWVEAMAKRTGSK